MCEYIILPDGYCLDLKTVADVSKVIDLMDLDDSGRDFEGNPQYQLTIYIKSSYPRIILSYNFRSLGELRTTILTYLKKN